MRPRHRSCRPSSWRQFEDRARSVGRLPCVPPAAGMGRAEEIALRTHHEAAGRFLAVAAVRRGAEVIERLVRAVELEHGPAAGGDGVVVMNAAPSRRAEKIARGIRRKPTVAGPAAVIADVVRAEAVQHGVLRLRAVGRELVDDALVVEAAQHRGAVEVALRSGDRIRRGIFSVRAIERRAERMTRGRGERAMRARRKLDDAAAIARAVGDRGDEQVSARIDVNGRIGYAAAIAAGRRAEIVYVAIVEPAVLRRELEHEAGLAVAAESGRPIKRRRPVIKSARGRARIGQRVYLALISIVHASGSSAEFEGMQLRESPTRAPGIRRQFEDGALRATTPLRRAVEIAGGVEHELAPGAEYAALAEPVQDLIGPRAFVGIGDQLEDHTFAPALSALGGGAVEIPRLIHRQRVGRDTVGATVLRTEAVERFHGVGGCAACERQSGTGRERAGPSHPASISAAHRTLMMESAARLAQPVDAGLADFPVLQLARGLDAEGRELLDAGFREIGAAGIAEKHGRAQRFEPGNQTLGKRTLVAHVA